MSVLKHGGRWEHDGNQWKNMSRRRVFSTFLEYFQMSAVL